MSDQDAKVERRDERFVDRVETEIWLEQASAANPYIACAAFCRGYDVRDLLTHCSYWEFIYLLLTGQRCTRDQHALLERLGMALANPGPRHPAVRAVMAASVSRTEPANLLPLGMSVLAGAHLGAAEVADAMHFLRRAVKRDPRAEAAVRLQSSAHDSGEGDSRSAPGFGTRYRGTDEWVQALASTLTNLPAANKTLAWANQFAAELTRAGAGGWLMPGLAAAAFLDLGFHPRQGAPLFQWLSAPGLIAHADEMATRPLTAFPFVSDDKYFIDGQ